MEESIEQLEDGPEVEKRQSPIEPEKVKEVFGNVKTGDEDPVDQKQRDDKLPQMQPLDLQQLEDDVANDQVCLVPAVLWQKLVKIRAVSKSGGQEHDGQVSIDPSTEKVFVNGTVFMRYLLALKQVAATNGVEIKVDEGIAEVVKPSASGDEDIKQNWFVITTQLEKLGILVDEKLKAGFHKTENILTLFSKLDRYIELTCGKETVQIDAVDPELFESNEPLVETVVPEPVVRDPAQQRDSVDFKEYAESVKQNPAQSQRQSPVQAEDEEEETPVLEKHPTHKGRLTRDVRATVDIINMKTSTELGLIENSLEFLLSLLARHFLLRPLTAAALLTNNNEFLCTAFQQGVKSHGYKPLYDLTQEIIDNSEVLGDLMLDEFDTFGSKRQVLEVLKTISTALFSSQPLLVRNGFEILELLFVRFDMCCENEDKRYELSSLVYNWVTGLEAGNLMQKLIYALQRCPEVSAPAFISLIQSTSVLREKTNKILRYDLHMHIGKHNHIYSMLVMEFLPHLGQIALEESTDPGEEQGSLVTLWLDYANREFEPQKPEKYKIPAIALLTELWLTHTEQADPYQQSILSNVRKAVKDSSRVLKLVAVHSLFRLLAKFSEVKNPAAPVIYRSLIFMTVEQPQDQLVRETCWQLFTEFYAKNPRVPVDLLGEPLTRIWQEAKFKVYEFDIQFLGTLLKHPKCSPQVACVLLEILEKFLGSVYTSLVWPVFANAICDHFAAVELVQQFTFKFTQACFDKLVDHERRQPKPFDVYNTRTSQYKNRPKEKDEPLTDQQLQEKTYRSVSYILLHQMLQRTNDTLKDNIFSQLTVARTELAREGLTSQVIERLASVHLLPKSDTWGQLVPIGSAADTTQLETTQKNEDTFKPATSTALVLYTHQMSTASFFKFKATQHLHKLRETNRQKESRMQEQKLEAIQQFEKRRANLRKQVDRRRCELGVVSQTAAPNQIVEIKPSHQPILAEDKQEPLRLIVYTPATDFENCELSALDCLIKQKKKLLAQTFQKYSNQGIYRVKQLSDYNSFDGSKNINETISLPEVIKLMKEAQIVPQLIKKEELGQLMRHYAIQNGLAKTLQFDFTQFVLFAQQISWNAYWRSKNHWDRQKRAHECVKAVLHSVETTMTRPHETIHLQDSEDDEVVQALQKTIEENPDYPLPAGYIKVTTKSEVTEYRIPPNLLPFVGRAHVLVVPLIDDLLSELFGIHYLEPFLSVKEEIRVKPIMKKPKKVLGNKDCGHIIERLVPFGPRGQVRTGFTSPHANVLLSPKLELEVAKRDPLDRPYFAEVAQTVELLIQAVERGSKDIYDAKPEKIINQALQLQRQQQLQEKLQWAESEKKRLKRSEQLKELLKKAKNEPKETAREQVRDQQSPETAQEPKPKHGVFSSTEEKPKAIRPVQASLKKKSLEPPGTQRQDNSKPLTDRELAAKRAQTAKKDPSALQAPTPDEQQNTHNFSRDEIYAKPAQQTEESTFKSRAKSVQPNKGAKNPEFQQRQLQRKEQLSQLQQAKVLLQMKEEETKRKEQAFREAIKRRTEAQLQSHKGDKNEDHKFDIELLEFLQKPDVAKVFQRYEKFMQKMFKFYVQQAKIEFGHDMQFRLENMNFKEFAKLGFQTRITPVLVTAEQLMQIFRNTARSQQYADELQSGTVTEGSTVKEKNVIQFINYSSFKKALCRLCIYSHAKLGGYEPEQLQKAIENDYIDRQKYEKLVNYVSSQQEAKREVIKLVTQEMQEEFAQFQLKSDQILNRKEGKYEQVIEQNKHLARERHEAEYAKWIKQQESLGRGLKQRIEERMGLDVDVDEALAAHHQINSSQTNTLPKQFKQFQSKGMVTDQLKKNDIRNDMFQCKTKMDVGLLSAGTIEQLFIFMGMEPKLSNDEIDRRLNAQRIENAGQKPTGTVKKQLNLKGADENMRQQIEAQIAVKHAGSPQQSSAKKPNVNTTPKIEYKWQRKQEDHKARLEQMKSAKKPPKSPEQSAPVKESVAIKEPVKEEEVEEEPADVPIQPHDPEGFLDRPDGVLKQEDSIEGQRFKPSPSPKAKVQT